LKGNNEKLIEKEQSNVVDLSFIFLILKSKFLFFISVTIIVSILLINKTLKEKIYFTTEGVVYVEKNGNFLNSNADQLLKKLLPTLDDDSRKQLIGESITNIVVTETAIIKSGYNVYLSNDRDSEYIVPNFLNWKTIYNQNVKNLTPSNKFDNYYITDAIISDVYLDKIKLVIKFVDFEEFKIFDKLSGKYLATSKIGKNTQVDNKCSFIMHREEKNQDIVSTILETRQLPEPLYLTIENQANYNNIKNSIKVTSGDTALVKVEITGDNPQMLSTFTKSLMSEFIKFDVDLKLKNMNKVHDFMQLEMDTLKKKQADYMDQLKQVRKESNSIVDDSFFKNTSSEANELKSNIRKNEIEIRKLKNYYQTLKMNKDVTKITLSSRPAYSSIAPISEKLDSALNELFKIQTKYTPQSIPYQDALNLVKKQKELLMLSINYRIKELEVDNNKIMKSYYSSKDKLMTSMETKDKIEYIKKQIAIVDDAYKGIYESDRSLLYNKVFIKYSNKIITEPPIAKTPTNKIVSKITINIVLGVIVGIIVTIIKHTFFSLFLSRVVVSKMTSSEIMGGIPKIQEKSITSDGLINFIKEDKIAELFKTLETLIFFNHPEIQTIQFTSPYPKDGKTFLSRNIAQSLASNNAKVILVTITYNIEKKQKLKEINSTQDLKNSIKRIKLYNNKYLYILPFNTTEQNMQLDAKLNKYTKILNSLKKSFDYVILDTPQYPMFSEPLSLSTIVDLSISVVKLNHTPVSVSGKHFRDISDYSNKHIVIINNDLIDVSSSGYDFIDTKNIKHKIVRLKQKLSQI
jgi:Mrp family chromosome partitioning ATPase